MSSIINYQNIAVSVGGTPLFANSASFSFDAPIEAIRSLGQQNAIADIINGPIEGTLNIDYIITNGSHPGKTISESIIAGTYAPVSVEIGGRTFSSSYLSSYSLSAEPNSIINASLSFNIYGPLNFVGMISSAAGTSTSNTIAHGANSNVATITNAINFEYSFGVEWEPIYVLSSGTPTAVVFRSAEETLNINGPNLGSTVVQCQTSATATVNIGALCGSNLFSITMSNAKIQNSESSVDAGGFVQGSYTLIKNY
jgi:hypothetical protein